MLSKVVIPLQTFMDAFREGDQKPENMNCAQQRNQSTACEASSVLPCVLHSYLYLFKGTESITKLKTEFQTGIILYALHLATLS